MDRGDPDPDSTSNPSVSSGTTDLTGAAGFWSYVRDDNDADGGRILDLATAIQAEYAMLTTGALELFIDRDDIKWGQEWERRINEAVAGTTFFIPIVSPRYFASPACRKELVQFAGKARSAGLDELLLPVLYIDVAELHEEDPSDDLVQLVKNTQWVDWRDHRLSDPADATFRRGVHSMATRLAEITDRVSRVPDGGRDGKHGATPRARPEADEDDEPGLMDVLAAGELALPEMNEAIEGIAAEVGAVGEIMQAATGDIATADAKGGGFAARLQIARKVAHELEPRAAAIEGHGRAFGTALVTADPAVQALLRELEQPSDPQEGSTDAEERQQVLGYLTSLTELGGVAEEGIGELREFLAALSKVASLSRDIKRPAARIQKGLQGLVDGQAVLEEWARSADEVEQSIASAQPVD